jgi:hypothetical protein
MNLDRDLAVREKEAKRKLTPSDLPNLIARRITRTVGLFDLRAIVFLGVLPRHHRPTAVDEV